ncbi:hypothetical protein L0244_27055 [bacterium]|nr:hypothetical protein [bacterium]
MSLLEQVLPIAIPIIAFLLMVVVGMDLKIDDFRKVQQTPKPFFVGFIGQFILPVLAICIARIGGLSGEILYGILLIAASPPGGISNYYTFLARANVALSVTLTTLSCLLVGITMPLLLKSFEFLVGEQLAISIPFSLLLLQSFGMLMFPVIIGIFLRFRAPAFVEKRSGVFRKFSFLALAALILFVVYQAREIFIREIIPITIASGALIILSLCGGFVLGAIFRLNRDDHFTVAIEYAVRNAAIATAVAVTILKRPEFAVFGTAYFLTEIPIILAAVALFRKMTSRNYSRSQSRLKGPHFGSEV